MLVEDVMSSPVVTGRPGMAIRDAIQRMEIEEIRHLPLVDEEGIMAVVSLRRLQDLIGAIRTLGGEAADYEGWVSQPIETILETRFTQARDVIVTYPETKLSVAIDLFLEHKLTAIPVVEDDDRPTPVGIVSYIDILEQFQAGTL